MANAASLIKVYRKTMWILLFKELLIIGLAKALFHVVRLVITDLTFVVDASKTALTASADATPDWFYHR